MKKLAVAVAGVAAMMAIPAVAGINPFDPGLPQAWNSTVYGVAIGTAGAPLANGNAATNRLTVLDSFSSAMCVECHGRNPSDKISDPSGAFIAAGNEANFMGSHAVVDVAKASNTGGGFTGGSLTTRARAARTGVRNGGQYEKEYLWLPSGQAGKGLSKYGSSVATFQDNDILAGVNTVVEGNVTCESCHNILVNRGDQLLLGGYNNGSANINDSAGANPLAADQICVACHSGAADAAGETYAAFHDNGNLRNFNGAELKRHHVLSNTAGTEVDVLVLARYNPDGVIRTQDSIMWAPNYTRELSGGYVAVNAAYAFNKGFSTTGQGALATAANTGDIPTTTQLLCVSCHRPHNAESTAGAFILRRGTAVAFTGNAVNGTDRQMDVDPNYANKVYDEYQPLCVGCHQY